MTNYLKIWGPFEPTPSMAEPTVKLGMDLRFYFFALHVDHGMRHMCLTYQVKEQRFVVHVDKSNAGDKRFKAGEIQPELMVGDYAEPIAGLLSVVLPEMLSGAQKAKIILARKRARDSQ